MDFRLFLSSYTQNNKTGDCSPVHRDDVAYGASVGTNRLAMTFVRWRNFFSAALSFCSGAMCYITDVTQKQLRRSGVIIDLCKMGDLTPKGVMSKHNWRCSLIKENALEYKQRN
jgi:hypothetical protein